MPQAKQFKLRVDRLLNDEHLHGAGRNFNLFMAWLILANVLALVLETIPRYQANYERLFFAFEVFLIVIFTTEYLLRLWVTPFKRKFIFSPMGIIDLIAILPFYLPYLHIDFRFLRTIRLLRLLRILKLARYSRALNTLIAVIMNKRHELLVAASFGALMLILTSSGIYFLENPVQPDKFSSIPDAMWWSVVTLTTVGYGDIYPITLGGRILGGLTAFFGIGMFALPAGILASGFAEVLKEEKHDHSTQILINIDVNDLSRATEFYKNCFHLTVGRQLGKDVVELIGLKSPIYLLANQEDSLPYKNAPQGRRFTRHWTPVHLDFVVPNIETAVHRARLAGANIESEISTEAWGKGVVLSDPFGNGFCLIEFLGSGYDQIATGPNKGFDR